jgi:acyl carrier protein
VTIQKADTEPTRTQAPDPGDATLAEVTGFIRDVIGEDYVASLDITMDTKFQEDLDMESIEFVELADRIRVRYGGAVDLVGFLAEVDIDILIEITVGDVVRLINDSLYRRG